MSEEIELTPEQQYDEAMHQYLKDRGEIQFTDSAQHGKIVSKNTIRKKQTAILLEHGFKLRCAVAADEFGGTSENAITALSHKGGHDEVLSQLITKWVQYPDGHAKQFNFSMDRQSAITYIHRQQLMELLHIYDGFNPEKEIFDAGVKSGNIELVTDEQAEDIKSALDGDMNKWELIVRGYKDVSKISDILASDFDNVIKDLS